MFKFLLEEAPKAGLPSWVLLVVLGVLLILMIVGNTRRSKQERENAEKFMSELKVGDKVRTYHGMYGTIISITETTDGAIAVLETGDETHKSYITMALAAIGGLDNKKDVVYDAEGNPIIPEEEQEEVKKEEVLETVEEKVEEVQEPEVKEETMVEEQEEVKAQTEEKPKKKATTKKSSTTAKKKTTKKSDE